MAARNYDNTVEPTAVAAPGITTVGQTVIPVTDASGFPPVPFTIGVDRGTADSEAMLVTAKDTGANTFTVTRGYDGTTAVEHLTGASVEHTFVAKDFQDANDHIEDTGLDHHTQYFNAARLDPMLPKTYTASSEVVINPINSSYQQQNTITIPSATFDRKVQFMGYFTVFGDDEAVYRAIIRRGAATIYGADIHRGSGYFSLAPISGWVTIPSGEEWTVGLFVKRDTGSTGATDDDPNFNAFTATVVPA